MDVVEARLAVVVVVVAGVGLRDVAQAPKKQVLRIHFFKLVYVSSLITSPGSIIRT